jgi:hypothetical protein
MLQKFFEKKLIKKLINKNVCLKCFSRFSSIGKGDRSRATQLSCSISILFFISKFLIAAIKEKSNNYNKQR